MKRTLITTAAICAVLCITATTYGLTDYQTRADGAWGDSSHWSKLVNDEWVDSDMYPGEAGSNPGTVTINSSHDMTVGVADAAAYVLNVDADLTINSNGIVTVDTNVNTTADGPIIVNSGGTVDIGGSADFDGSVAINTNGVMTVDVDVAADAAFTVSGNVTISRDVTANSTVAVNGTGEMTITRNAEINGTVTVSGDMAVTGNIDANADITINANGTLTASGDIDLDADITINADGTLVVNGAGTFDIALYRSVEINATGSSNYGTLQFSATRTVTGSGKIEGTSDHARISIDASRTLTSETNIEGHLQITGSGSFDNDGVVEANVSGTLLVNVTGSSSLDGSSGTWKATTSSSATLEFGADLGDNDSAISMVSADFYISHGAKIQIDEMNGASIGNPFITTTGHLEIPSSGGTLDCRESVTMGGPDEELDMDAGSIFVAADKTFIHN